jgi:hypothetical protein
MSVKVTIQIQTHYGFGIFLFLGEEGGPEEDATLSYFKSKKGICYLVGIFQIK